MPTHYSMLLKQLTQDTSGFVVPNLGATRRTDFSLAAHRNSDLNLKKKICAVFLHQQLTFHFLISLVGDSGFLC